MPYRDKLHESIRITVKKLIDHEPEIMEVEHITSPVHLEDFSIVMGVVGEIDGQLIFGFEKSILDKIARKMGNQEEFKPEKFMLSIISEFSNILTGNAVTYLSEHGFENLNITPPTTIMGSDIALSTKVKDIAKYELSFDEFGSISLYVALQHEDE
jgi:chemotaxis protein CheX